MFRISIVGLWFISSGIAAIADLRSCDDQSGGGGFYLLPLVVFALIADRTWNIKILRISGALVSIAFFMLIIWHVLDTKHVEIGPCDRKGDERIQGLLFVQVFVIPVLWAMLAFFGLIIVIAKDLIGTLLLRAGLKKPNSVLDSDDPSDRRST
jgi:hypothetical protein